MGLRLLKKQPFGLIRVGRLSNIMNWQKIIEKEIRKPKITYFNVGRKKYPYLILPFDTRISFKFQKAVIEGLSQILKNEIKKPILF